MSSSPHGHFLWYELNTTDPDAAVRFYTSVVGWGTERWDGAGEPYTMWTAAGQPIGGVMRLPEEVDAPPHWLGYVGVDDVEETLEQAQKLGATLHFGPHDIPEVGRIAVISDPHGAVLSLFHPLPMDGGSAQGDGNGHIGWHELAADDADAALDFYQQLFGWQKGSEFDMGDGWIYHMLRQPGRDTDSVAIYRRPPEIPAAAWTYYIEVPDADTAVRAAGEHGGAVLNGPMDVPGGDRVAVCADPQGAAFAVLSRATVREKTPA